MKPGHAVLVTLVGLLPLSCAGETGVPVLSGPYLGQRSPGNTAAVFAPGIVSTDSNEVLFGFYNAGSLLFFERSAQGFEGDWIQVSVYRSEISDSVWTQPRRSSVTGRPWYHEYSDAPEGTTIVFPWRKNLDGSGPRLDIDIWKVVKAASGWEAAYRFGPPVNTDSFDSWPSLARDGTLYFFSARDGGFGGLDLYRSRRGNGDYAEVENLGDVINTEFNDHDPFVAPDESFLIFCSNRPGGLGENDLYITFRLAKGGWTIPRNLGAGINTPGDDNRPYATSDGRYLFFNSTVSGTRDIHWVESGVLDDLRAEAFR
jgi:hypothetical protein